MSPPVRSLPSARRIPGPVRDPVADATADVALPRPALMDRLHFMRADAAQVQRTVGNQMAQRLAHERRATGDALPNERTGAARGAKVPGPARPDDDPLLAKPAVPAGAPPAPMLAGAGTRPPGAPPPEPPAAMGVPVVAPPPPAAARTIGDVQSQVSRAADALPHPAAGYSAAQQAIRAQGFRLASARGGGAAPVRQTGGGGAKHAVVSDRPAEPDPVPRETKALMETANQSLPAIPTPKFEPTPQKHIPPHLGARPISKPDFESLMLTPDAARQKAMEAEDKRRLEDRAARRTKELAGEKDPKKKARLMAAKPDADEPRTLAELRELLATTPKPEDLSAQAKKGAKSKAADDAVPKYVEPPPPGPIVFGEAKKDQMGKVLAGLLANEDATADEILALIRPNVEAKVRLGPTLPDVFPYIGMAQKGKVLAAYKARVADLQKGAGITDAELAKKVAERRAELIRLRAEAQAAAAQARKDAAEGVRTTARTEAATIDVKKDAAAGKAATVKKAAPKIKLPMDVDGRRTRLLGYVAKDVADLNLRYKQKGDIRAMTVDRMARDYIDAYRFAAQQEVYASKTSGQKPGSAAAGQTQKTTDDWLARVIKSVETTRAAQHVTDAAAIVTMQGKVRTAGAAKSEAIRTWAEHTSGRKRSAEQKQADAAADKAEREKSEAGALADLEKGRLALGVAGDFGVVDRIADAVKQGQDRETIVANLHLNGVQTAILDAYLKPPVPGDDRALSGVMAGLKVRLQMELQKDIGPAMEAEIQSNPTYWYNAKALAKLGQVQSSDFNPTDRAQRAHAALDKMDTDEDAVYDALKDLTKIQAQALRLEYVNHYNATLDDDLKGGYVYGMSGKELQRAQTLLEGNQKKADAIGVSYALKGNEGVLQQLGVTHGSSEELDKIFHGKSLEERQGIEDEYNAEHDPVLKARLAGVTDNAKRDEILKQYRDSGQSMLHLDAYTSLSNKREKDKFDFSMKGDDESADALELRALLPTPADVKLGRQVDSGIAELVVVGDRKKVQAIFDRIRREASERGDREGWTSAQVEAEIARRSAKIEAVFDERYGKEYNATDKGALRTAFDIGFRHSDAEKKFANALVDNDLTAADAAKIQIEHQGVYADDDIENAVLASQNQRALADLRRDELPLRRMAMTRELAGLETTARQKARQKAIDEGHPERAEEAAKKAWTGADQWAARERLQRELDRSLEDAAAEQAKGNMNALRERYKRDYGGDLDAVVKSDTSGYSGDKAELLLAQNGRLTLGQTMFYAIRGAGTDEEALDTLKGHTKAEIDVARKQFKVLAEAEKWTARGILNRVWDDPGTDETNMDTEILADVSGRTGFDVGQMLKGEPETIDEKKQRLIEAVDWEKQSGPLGDLLGADQQDALQIDLDDLSRTIDKLKNPDLSPELRDAYLGFFDQEVETVHAGIRAHREVLDTWTDRITTVVGIVVGIAVTALTFGAAGPVFAAVLGSIAATAATMSTKAVILGAAYGWEDIATDIAVGIVDAFAAALTAGMGEKLLGVAKGAAGPEASKLAVGRAIQRALGKGGALAVVNPAESMLARAIPTSAALKEMVERGGLAKLFATVLAEGGEAMIASAPSALAGGILDENNYKEGNPLGNILAGTAHQMATSAGMALGMKAGLHVGKSGLDFGKEIFRAMRTPEAPELHSFTLAQKEFPGISHEEFTKLRAAAIEEVRLRERASSELPAEREARPEGPHEAPHETAGERSSDRQPLPDERLPNEEPGAKRPSESGPPAADNPNLLAPHDVTSPRGMTEAQVHEMLPPSLRDKVAVKVDPSQKPGAVKVERIKRLGVIVEVRLVVGPHVRPIDIAMHAQTMHAMQRYVGITGTIIRAVEHARSLIVRDGFPPHGSKAWEAFHELNKLPHIIEQRLDMLRTGALDPHAEAQIHADLENISRQIDVHRETLARMDTSPGAGYIALEGAREPGPRPLDERPASRADRGNKSIERFIAEGSAQENNRALREKYPNAQFLSVGEPWFEAKADGKRVYRVLEVRDRVTDEVLLRHEEILQVGPKGEEHWVQRGSESNVKGASAEEAFQTKFESEQGTKRKGQILLPKELVQLGGGQGFDGVIVKFDEHGRATIVLVEVKNYPNRFVPLEDITAIRENLKQNLKNLHELLGDKAMHGELGLTAEQAKQARRAITAKRLEFEVQIGDTTHLGEVSNKQASVMRDLRRSISARLGESIPQENVRLGRIEGEHMRLGERLVEARERLGIDDTRELRALARGNEKTMTAEGIRRAEAAIAVQEKMPKLVDRPLRATSEPHTFIDAANKPFKVFTPEKGASATKLAAEVASSLKSTRGNPGAPTRMVVDVSRLTPGQQQTLRAQLKALAKGSPKLDLGRVLFVDTPRGTVKPFPPTT